ncbi:MAG: GNAT family N-acetyltransferase [Planctomycetaceae bacterium]
MTDVINGITMRRLTDSDIDAASELCRLAGWNQLPNDWRRLRNAEPDGCFAAVSDDRVVGTVTTTTYGTGLAWIGMMLVHPEFRRMGIGTLLMKQALSFLESRNIACIKLDASPDGFPLYEQLGFHDLWSFHRWHRIGDGSVSRHEPAPKTIDPGLRDERAFGACRALWLERLARDSIVVTRPEGFGMLRSGHLASYLGPITATETSTAESIVEELLRETSGSVFWDVPSPNQPAQELADKLGFEPVRTLTRMWTGRQFTPADESLQFALCDPATG